MRTHPSLPDGYQLREVAGRMYLFDPQGIPLLAPTDVSLIGAYAWRHAWRQIDRELNKELADFRAGVRPLHSLRRLRQYLRMLDAMAQAPREVERPLRRGMVAWGAVAASAAAIAAVLLVTPLRTPPIPERTPHPNAASEPAARTDAKHPAPVLPAEPRASRNVRVGPTTRAGATSPGPVRAARTGPHRPALVKYAVSFGAFVDRITADTMMHDIRSKGYIAYVAQRGEDFLVVTRPYHTRAQAERLVVALREIGLPAQLAATRAI